MVPFGTIAGRSGGQGPGLAQTAQGLVGDSTRGELTGVFYAVAATYRRGREGPLSDSPYGDRADAFCRRLPTLFPEASYQRLFFPQLPCRSPNDI